MALPMLDQLDRLVAGPLVAFAGVGHRARTLHGALVDLDDTGGGDNAELTGPLAETLAVLNALADRLARANSVAGIADALDEADRRLAEIASRLADDAQAFDAGGDILRAQLAGRILTGVIDPALTTIAETNAAILTLSP